MEIDDDALQRELERITKEHDRTIEIPDGLTEDEAVASAIEQYKEMTGMELAEEDVRAEVRRKMAGRDTT
ncbi:hypothetical protein MYSE111917_16590 [Mycobacterium senriense]|uniref:Uncharacterized protein n=1 Tax=Mycobacterium senriense TaxID=2775496 RepID=A0ABN6ILX9_9MYCO|nr:hypothetical protein [Mycobacterium senriense]BCZ24859.1 hypothetical protein MTY59_47140 [Mycobacterium senriense]